MQFEIFKTGTHKSDKGIERFYSEEDLDKIAESYNPENHEAPIVIGHPKTNAPAYGWIENVKRAGDKLIAKAKDVNDDFKSLLKSKAFKKRSISLTPDLKLNHVGFLGAAAPAVKGLKDIEFNAEDTDTIDFDLNHSAVELDTDEQEVQQDENKDEQKPAVKSDEEKPQASGSDVSKEKDTAVQIDYTEKLDNIHRMLTDLNQNFADNNISKEDLNNIYNRISELRTTIQVNEFEMMLNEKLAYGSVTPAMKTKILSLIDFIQQQNFSENFSQLNFVSGVKSQLKDIIECIPKIVHFDNFADTPEEENKDTADDEFSEYSIDEEASKIHKKALSVVKQKNITYLEALNQVAGEMSG